MSATRQQGPVTRGPAEGGHVLWGQAGPADKPLAARVGGGSPAAATREAPSVAPDRTLLQRTQDVSQQALIQRV